MNNEQFTRLVSNWLDGTLTEFESQKLQSELEDSLERRNEFADLCGLDADLRSISDGASDLTALEPSHRQQPGSKIKPRLSARSLGLMAVVAAAVLLAIGYGIGRDRTNNPSFQTSSAADAPVESSEVVESGCAVLSRIVDATFADGLVYREGDTLPAGPLKLQSGFAQIDFFSGATMLMDESAEVTLVSSWEAECKHGKVTMNVPPPAIGFRLLLPGMKVVDLGTEFGVEVDGPDSAVHVFEGEVEAHVSGLEMKIIREGESLATSDDQPPRSSDAHPANFPSVERFEEQIHAFNAARTASWWATIMAVRQDPRLLGCYLFKQWEDKRWDRLVNNFTLPRHRSRAGSAVGTRWVEGRWPTKTAMEFKSPGDRVRINLGDRKYSGLTMAAWIRVDGLDRKYNALLLTDGYEDGEPHWQIDESGRLMFSVSYWKSPTEKQTFQPYRQNQIYYSPPIFGKGSRRWHHVAVTFDATNGEAVQYLDGVEISRGFSEHHRDGRMITFGACEIGNWGLPLEGVPFPVRNLNGRVDEFLIYRKPLSGDEISHLHEIGTPN